MATRAELARHLDMLPRTTHDLLAQSIIPDPVPGANGIPVYDLDASRVAYIRHLRKMASVRAPTGDRLELMAERTRKEAAHAEKLEFEMSVAKKEYVPIAVLEDILERFASACAAKFDSIGARLKQNYPELKARHIEGIKKEIAETRNYIAGLSPDLNN